VHKDNFTSQFHVVYTVFCIGDFLVVIFYVFCEFIPAVYQMIISVPFKQVLV